jgi:hypothetical protein
MMMRYAQVMPNGSYIRVQGDNDKGAYGGMRMVVSSSCIGAVCSLPKQLPLR